MQQHTLLPELGYAETADFWSEVKALNKKIDGDEILAYMHCLLRDKPELVTRAKLREHGAALPYFPGVRDWFARIRNFGSEHHLDVNHYIVSSGLQEMIDGSDIRKNFRHIFASNYAYEGDLPRWPAVAINYTSKTQYLFRINKGILNYWDDKSVNQWVPMDERPVPFERMIFIGDGDTDIPAMKMLTYQGGTSIAVFDPARFQGADQSKVYKLIAEDRAHYVCPADYSDGSQLDVTVKGTLGKIARASGYRPKKQPAIGSLIRSLLSGTG